MTKIQSEYITLGQLLKIENIVSTGGEAKNIINFLDIKVNGVRENRRGKKLYLNDKIIINNKEYIIEK